MDTKMRQLQYSGVGGSHYKMDHFLSCFLYWELKDNVLASELLVDTLKGLNLPFCAVPVLGVQVHLYTVADSSSGKQP